MSFYRGTGCVIGIIAAIVFAILAVIGIVILVNAIQSIDYQAAANDLKQGIQDFNSTLKSFNPTTPETTSLITVPLL